MSKRVLGREALGRAKFKTIEHEVPEWDGVVILRRLAESEVARIQQEARAATKKRNEDGDAAQSPEYLSRLRRTMVFTCWVDEDGAQVLTEREDLDALAKEEFAIIDGIAEAAARHNGMLPDAERNAEKNSDAILKGDSGSD